MWRRSDAGQGSRGRDDENHGDRDATAALRRDTPPLPSTMSSSAGRKTSPGSAIREHRCSSSPRSTSPASPCSPRSATARSPPRRPPRRGSAAAGHPATNQASVAPQASVARPARPIRAAGQSASRPANRCRSDVLAGSVVVAGSAIDVSAPRMDRVVTRIPPGILCARTPPVRSSRPSLERAGRRAPPVRPRARASHRLADADPNCARRGRGRDQHLVGVLFSE